jgi:CDP-diacylglycerol--glycerol-3-phosphate 3-phosphatidyltransferase/cardiolipin synthase
VPEPDRPNRLLAPIPNLLSVLRLGMAAAFPFVPAEPPWRLVVVIAAGFTDWLDGFLARRFGLKTPSGVILDAVADKLFVLSVVATLTLTGALPIWWMLLVISRDLAVGLVAAYVTYRRDWPAFRRLVPRLPGKLTTGFQFALFLTLLIWPETPFATFVFVVTAICSVVAALDYLALFGQAYREDLAERRATRGAA